MITGIDHIALIVRNLDDAVASYAALLGRGPSFVGRLDGGRHAWFRLPNAALNIRSPDEGTGDGNPLREQLDKAGEGIWGIGFRVTDLDAASRTLERRGVPLLPRTTIRSEGTDGVTRHLEIAIARRDATHGVAEFFVERRENDPAWPLSPAAGEDAVAGLDHVVVHTPNVDRAAAHYGARLGLDLRLDRANEQWGSRLLFFRCGDSIVEIGANLTSQDGSGPDRFGGLAWRVNDPAAAHARLLRAGFELSELRKGRKPGTLVFTVRNRTVGVPTLMLQPSRGGA